MMATPGRGVVSTPPGHSPSALASSSRLPSSSPFASGQSPISPSYPHAVPSRGAAASSVDAAARATSMKAANRLTRAASPAAPIDHDFVVQAANPNHPEHQRWLESFASGASSSRRRKPEGLTTGGGGEGSTSARRKPSRPDLGNGSARSRETSDNVALASSDAATNTRMPPSRSTAGVATRSSISADSHGRRIGLAAPPVASNSSDSSADEGATAGSIRPTSPYRSIRKRSSVADARLEDATLPARTSSSVALEGGAHLNGQAERAGSERRRRKKRKDRLKHKDRAPAPPMPPPRISSSVNYQSLHSPMMDVDLSQQQQEPPQPLTEGFEPMPYMNQSPAQPLEPVAGPLENVEPSRRARQRPQPSQSDVQLLRDAGIGPEVPAKEQILPPRIASNPASQMQRTGPSLPARNPARRPSLSNRLASAPTANHEQTSAGASQLPEGKTIPRQRSTSFDILRSTFSPAVAPIESETGSGNRIASSSAGAGSKVRASLDGVRPRFLTFSRGTPALPDDASEADSSVSGFAGGSQQGTSSVKGPRKLRTFFSSLKLGSHGTNSAMPSKQGNVSVSALPIGSAMDAEESSSRGRDRRVSEQGPQIAASRSTQSMDLPRPSLTALLGNGRNESPPVPLLPAHFSIVDPQHGTESPKLWANTGKARLSLVGEETEIDSDHPRASMSGADRDRAAKAPVIPPSPIAEVNENSGKSFGFPRIASKTGLRSPSAPVSSTGGIVDAPMPSPLASEAHTTASTHSREGTSDTFGRKNRLASLWTRGAAPSSQRERSQTMTDGIASKEILVEWGRASPSVSSRMGQSHRTQSSQGESVDISGSLADSCDTAGTTGLGIHALEPQTSRSSGPVHESRPATPSAGGWRSRVSSLASIKSVKKARSQIFRDSPQSSSSPVPPPLPTMPGQKGPSMSASSSTGTHSGVGVNGSSAPDELWRRNLLAEAVGLSLDASAVGDKATSGGIENRPIASRSSPPNGPSSKGKRTPLLEVVAAGRKSFSRDRGKSKGLDAPDESMPTIHRTLGPALLSDLTSQSGHAERDEAQSSVAGGHSEEELEPWDGMDDDANESLAAPFVPPRKVSVGGTPKLEGIAEQDTTSTEGSRSQSRSGSQQSRSVVPGAGSTPASPPLSRTGDVSTTIAASSSTTPSAQIVSSFSSNRHSMGKMQSTPPHLHLQSPNSTPFASSTNVAAAEESGRFNEFVVPSPSQDYPQSPAPPAAIGASSSGRRTPRLWSSSQAGRKSPGASLRSGYGDGGGVSPSHAGRTSFSTDRDRAPVASPYVQHQGIRSRQASADGGGIKGALKKLVPGGSSGGLSVGKSSTSGTSSPMGRGISSEQFQQRPYQDGRAEFDSASSREDLLPEGTAPNSGPQQQQHRFQPSPSASAGLRDPWDDSLASAQAATRMLEVEHETLQPSPLGTPLFRHGGGGSGGGGGTGATHSTAGPHGAEQASIRSGSSRSDLIHGDDTASERKRSTTPAGVAMNRAMMSSSSSLQAAITASSGAPATTGNLHTSRSMSTSEAHDTSAVSNEAALHSPQTPSRSSGGHNQVFYTPPTAASMLPSSSMSSMPTNSSAVSPSASTLSHQRSGNAAGSSSANGTFLPSHSSSSSSVGSMIFAQPSNLTAADPLEALFRQQKAREAEMLRSISEKSRRMAQQGQPGLAGQVMAQSPSAPGRMGGGANQQQQRSRVQ
ncbi:hypothetical protein BDZ90DRAFT_162611 [Jaminaea rosea]|uniref:Uncharacterized protein n=1 Tax=Jaminaea rosea TaxID=1569628 RepID=A0A316UUU5_9BASI|nr:hypothetical protein BDZ90DRAFT_162611 [Jaminaea rosea]PWN28101.1 hypothetical protein BDZ90DRAFT_162611 [Jaminaea rosea]